jgi:putative ABC transport system permease protein
MSSSRTSLASEGLPRVARALLRLLLPRPERDELLADLAEEFARQARERGDRAARQWLWWQTLRSAPALLRWSWWRGWTGFEPRANDFRPGDSMLRSWLTDFRYTAQRLRARPSYALVSVVTLALGIGGIAAIFGIARPVMLDPLPYANAADVGSFWMPGWWTEEEFLYLRGKFPGFQSVAAYRPGDVTLRSGDAPARLIPGLTTSAEFFDVLGARPLLGRTFQKGDDAQGAEPVAVISYGLWREMGGSTSILGTRLALDGTPTTIVGVMPKNFWFPDPAVRVWHARALDPEGRNGSYTFIGRAAPGVDVHHMDAQLHRLTQIIGQRFQYEIGADKTLHPAVTPLRDALLGSMRPSLIATLIAMGLILLIACANVAALMLGQVEGRAAELAVRSALGASRGRLLQQLVAEAILVGVLAAAAGAGLAVLGFRLLAESLPIGAWAEHASFDWTLFLAAFGISLVAVLLVVLVPAWSLWRGDLRSALSGARTGGIQGRGGRLERGLVIAEVTLAMLIASSAALLVRSVANLYAISPGIETHGIAVVDALSSPTLTASNRGRLVASVVDELRTLPGVRSVSAAMKIPLRGGGDSFGITIPGQPDAERTFTYFRIVTRDYFATLGIPLHAGRAFDSSDQPITTDDSSHVMSVVVNDAFVKKYYPHENPIGRVMGGGFSGPQRIVGVVGNVAEAGLTDERSPVRYYLAGQAPWFSSPATFVIRTTDDGRAVAMLDDARRAVQRVAPALAVQSTTTMSRVFDAAVGPARQVMTLLALLSGLALLLGGVGIYGVIAHFVARRRRDWAIRLALGLAGRRVMTHVVGQGTALVAAGVAIGAVAAVGLAHLLASFLFGVRTIDPLAFAAAAVALLLIGAVAAFIPAYRAANVDPVAALREQ